jgi:hypothetical protein
MRALLAEASAHVSETSEHGVTSVELPLDELVATEEVNRQSSLYRLLGLVAKGALVLAKTLEELGERLRPDEPA